MLPKGRLLYFDEEAHKYTDDIGSIYTSTTTVIGKYYEKFDIKIAQSCERIGKNPSHPKYPRYKGKTAKQIIFEWEELAKVACDKGTKKHNYLETAVKASNGYIRNAKGFINGRIYTIDDIIKGHSYGKLTLEYFKRTGIDQAYPTIYGLISDLTKSGFKIYAEIGVYDTDYCISGLIDILLVKGNEFMILDWKTNKAPIRFESGYYEKDNSGKQLLDKFIFTNKYFNAPISHIPDSTGHHYTLQLSTYDFLVESFGFKNIGNILCHIRTVDTDTINPSQDKEEEEVKFLSIEYLKDEVKAMLMDNLKRNLHNKTLF